MPGLPPPARVTVLAVSIPVRASQAAGRPIPAASAMAVVVVVPPGWAVSPGWTAAAGLPGAGPVPGAGAVAGALCAALRTVAGRAVAGSSCVPFR